MLGWQPKKWLEKKAKRGLRGYPVSTIAFYGPDERLATKVAVAIIPAPQAEPTEIRRWFTENRDIRTDDTILAEVVAFLRDNGIHSVAMVDKIIGCPHEEGVDCPKGESCPKCPNWAGRDRWTGEADAH